MNCAETIALLEQEIKALRMGRDMEVEGNKVHVSTRDHGDVAEGEVGAEDMRRMRALRKQLKVKFPNLEMEVEAVDEWACLAITVPKDPEPVVPPPKFGAFDFGVLEEVIRDRKDILLHCYYWDRSIPAFDKDDYIEASDCGHGCDVHFRSSCTSSRELRLAFDHVESVVHLLGRKPQDIAVHVNVQRTILGKVEELACLEGHLGKDSEPKTTNKSGTTK